MSKYTVFNITKIDENNLEDWEEIYNFFLSDLENLYDELYKFKLNYKFEEKDKKKNTLYLITFGGGPEGGYMILKNGIVCRVCRNWMTTFNFRNVGYYKSLEIGTTGETLYCKINYD